MKIITIKYSRAAFSFATLILRLGLGIIMLFGHGKDKLLHFSEYSANFSDPFHIGSAASLSLDIFAEFFCSCLVILGLFTRLACIPLIIAMSVALFYAQHGNVFGGGERAAIFLTGYITLLFLGPGKVSVDGMIGR